MLKKIFDFSQNVLTPHDVRLIVIGRFKPAISHNDFVPIESSNSKYPLTIRPKWAPIGTNG